MENLDDQTIDNLYKAGLAHYIEALFAARHFECLIDQSIVKAFDDDHKNRLIKALGGQQLDGGGFFSNSPGSKKAPEVQNATQQQWWMWVTHNYWIRNPGINLLIGYHYEVQNSYAVIAMDRMRANIRNQMLQALADYKQNLAVWNGYEIFIHSKPLCLGGSQQDFISALQGILDGFIDFLEHKNQQTPNWIATLV